MDNARAWTTTRTIHHIAWWVFVVATLFAGGVTWLGGRGRLEPFIPRDLVYDGAHRPLQGVEMSKAYDTSLHITLDFPSGPPEVISLGAFVVVIIAAVIEAILVRRIVIGVASIAIPLIAVAVIAFAVPSGTWGTDLGSTATMLVVGVGISLHQGWMYYIGRRQEHSAHSRRSVEGQLD